MSEIQHAQTVELERAWREEIEAREIERANEILAEMKASRGDEDDRFIESLAEKYPSLRAWPGRKESK